MRHSLLIASVTALLAGCVAGPDYRPDAPQAPLAWSALEAERLEDESTELATWWRCFGDARLDALMQRARAANLDLELATARVREARARAGQVRAERLPQLDATGAATRARSSENGLFDVPGEEHELYSAGFDARWELDFFGRIERASEAADAEIEASIEDRRAVLVSLYGEVARAYVELRGHQLSAAIARRNAQAARSTVELTRARQGGGIDSALDVARAEALLASTEASLPRHEAGARVALHRLGILLAEHPGALEAELGEVAAVPAAPERVFVGLPSDLLERRPDLRAAERRLAAATARIGSAQAERYPSFSLSAGFGLESTSSSDFADAASRAWSIGPELRWPLFAGGRIDAQVELQDALAEQARLAQRQAWLLALEEVENALVRYLREWDQRRALESAVAANRRSVELAGELSRNGLTSFLDVLDAERSAYAAELELAASETASALHVVALYKALGGGWDPAGEVVAQASSAHASPAPGS